MLTSIEQNESQYLLQIQNIMNLKCNIYLSCSMRKTHHNIVVISIIVHNI